MLSKGDNWFAGITAFLLILSFISIICMMYCETHRVYAFFVCAGSVICWVVYWFCYSIYCSITKKK